MTLQSDEILQISVETRVSQPGFLLERIVVRDT